MPRARKRKRNASFGLPRNKWVNARVRITKGGKIQAAVSEDILGRLFKPKRKNSRRRNVAAGFVDEEGLFHPIRASFDYSGKRAGDAPKRRAPRKRRRR
jgi:hypothetical protein